MNRSDHIQSLLNDPTLKPSTRRVSTRDDSTYDTVFSTKDGDALILRIHVPISGNTPRLTSAPKMTLVGFTARHPWIDSSMKVTGFPHIATSAAFQKSGLTLAQAVNQVVQHMQLNPPTNIVIVDESLRKMNEHIRRHNNAGTSGRQSVNNSSHSNGSAHSSGNGNGNRNSYSMSSAPAPTPPPPPPQYNLPPHFSTAIQMTDMDERKKQNTISKHLNTSGHELPSPSPSSFPAIEQMNNRQEIKNLLENMTQPDQMKAVTQILSQTPLYRQMQETLQLLTESNAEAANRNLQKEKDINVLCASISESKQSLKEKVELLEELQTKQGELVKPMERNEILYELKRAKKEKMEESEEMAQRWLQNDTNDGYSDTDAFVEQFLKSRTVHHVRAAKMERIEFSTNKGLF